MPDTPRPDEPGATLHTLDHAAFVTACERYRRPLRVFCYRMLGSFDEAEDMVQETLLRAWRGRENFEGRSLVQTWLYRIATNVCLSHLERSPRRVLPMDVATPVTQNTPASEARSRPTHSPELPWLQPYPDALLDSETLGDTATESPDGALVRRESIGLAFLVALQHLSPKPRSILILTEVLGWSAVDVAELLETTVASVNSALQRARETLRERLPPDGDSFTTGLELSSEQERALRVFMNTWEHGDVAELTALLREDARWSMPPAPLWFLGKAAIENLLRLFPPGWQGRQFKMLAVGANRQPAAAAYLRQLNDTQYRLSGLHVLRVEGPHLVEITTFGPELCAGFGLPAVL